MQVDTIGPYKLLDRLGEGGIGEAFRARDTRHGRTVVLRVLHPALAADADRRTRFLADAQAAMRLSHPNLAASFDAGADGTSCFIATEYVAGDRLSRLIAGTPLNCRRAVSIALQISDAMAEMHAAGLLHRDVKPDTVMVSRKGQAKLLDAGLTAWTWGGRLRAKPSESWRRVGADEAGRRIPEAVALATAPYLAPEQALGMVGDERTDLYGLGAVLYEMLTGRAPFSGALEDVTLRVMHDAPVPAARVNAAVPPELDALVSVLLAKDPALRPASAAAVSARLREIVRALDAGPLVRDPTEWDEPRSQLAWWILVVLLLAAGMIAWGVLR